MGYSQKETAIVGFSAPGSNRPTTIYLVEFT